MEDERPPRRYACAGKRWYEGPICGGCGPTWSRLGTIVFWVIVVLIVVYFFYIEQKHLGCYVKRQKLCTSHFYRVGPEEGDDEVDLLQRIENGIRLPEETVQWRRNLITAIVIAIVLSIVYQRDWPRPGVFIVATVLVYIFLFSITNWYEMHYWYRTREDSRRTLDTLRVKLGVMKEPQGCGLLGPSETRGLTHSPCVDA
jgi:hypothetical protein